MTAKKPKTLEQRTMGERLFENARTYLTHSSHAYYVYTYGEIIISGDYAKSGLYDGKAQAYIRVVKTFMFFLELHMEDKQ